MTVKRRKSNWYIYLITFVIASALAAMIMSIFWDVIFPEREASDYSGIRGDIPDASNNIKILFMLSEEKAGAPTRYMLMSYQPADETIVCIPIRSDMEAVVGNRRGPLYQLYLDGGVQTIMYAIEGTMGVKCDRYVKFSRDSFVSMIDAMGKVTVNCAYDVLSSDGSVLFESGTHQMNGTNLYSYICYDNPAYGDDYQSLVLGSAAVSIFNSNLHGLSATVIQSYFTKLMNTTDTNLTLEDYTKRQQAFLFTSVESFSPGQYYIPYGEVDGGVFKLADSSKATIQQRLRLTE